MKGKISQRILSAFLSAVMVMSMMTMSVITVNAADEDILNITIKDVVRRYTEVEEIFNGINQKRVENGKSALNLGEDLTESAMVRAAELLLRQEEFDLLDDRFSNKGIFGNDFDADKRYEAIIVSENDLDEIINDLADGIATKSAVLASNVLDMGIGVISPLSDKSKRYICIRTSNEAYNRYYDDTIDVSALPSEDQTINQETQALTNRLKIESVDSLSGMSISKGQKVPLTFKASYDCDESGTAELIPVLSANPVGIINCNQDGTIEGVASGVTNVSMTLEGEDSADYTRTVTVYVTSKMLSSCTYEYKDAFTYKDGEQFRPTVVVKDTDGTTLIEGTDYTVSYGENREIGTGTIYFTGLGEYLGTFNEEFFTIVEPPYADITLSKTRISLGGTVLADIQPGGGIAPYNCVVYYDDPTGDRNDAYTENGKYVIPADMVGEYTVYVNVTDSDGVSVEEARTFEVVSELNASFENDSYSVMAGKTVETKVNVSGGIEPYKYSYKYSTGTTVSGTTDNINVSAGSTVGEKTLIVTVTDAEGNKAEAETIINVVDKISNKLVAEKSSVYVGDTVNLTSESAGGVGNITYQFYVTFGGQREEITGAVGNKCTYVVEDEGSYTFSSTATDEQGNLQASSVTVTVKKYPTLELKTNTPYVLAGTRTTINAAATGGYTPYTYQFEVNPECTKTSSGANAYITPTEAGDYTVSVVMTDKFGTELTDSIVIHVADKLTLSMDQSAAMAYVGETVVFNADGNGGFAPYEYVFTDKNGNTLPSDGNQLLYTPTEKVDQKITVTYTDSRGNKSTTYKTLKVADPFSIDFAASADHVLEGTSVKFTTTVTGGFSSFKYAYQYSSGEAINGTSATVTVPFKTAGDYSVKVTVTDQKGTQLEKTIDIYVAPKLTITTNINSTYVHIGDVAPVDAVAEGGFGNYRYEFTLDDNPVDGVDNIYNFAPTEEGTYVVKTTVYDEYGFSASRSDTFKAAHPFSVSLDASKTRVLVSEKITLTTTTVGGFSPYTFKYAYSNGGSVSGSSATTSVTPSKAGAYTVIVTVKDASGEEKQADVSFVAAEKLKLTTTVSDEAIFKGQDAEFTAELTGGFEPYTYEFTYGDGVKIPSQGNEAVLTPDENGDYVVTIKATDDAGNSLQQTKTIKVADELILEVVTSQTEFVVGDSTTFTNTVKGGFDPVTITYSATNGGSVSVVNGIGTFKPSKSGDYIVTVTAKDKYAHTVPIDVPIKVVDKLSATITADNQYPFVNNPAVLTATAKGGFEDYTYEFTLDDGTPLASQGNKFTFIPTEAGTTPINVKITDSKQNEATARMIITAADVLSAELQASADNVLLGTKVTYKAVVTGGFPTYTYKYTDADGKSLGTSSSYTFNPAEEGIYVINLTVTDKYGNKKELSHTVNVASQLNAALSASAAQAQSGEEITFTAQASGGFGNYTYTFKKGDGSIISSGTSNTATIGSYKEGTYTDTITVEVTDSCGFVKTASVKVVFVDELKVTLTPVPSNTLKGKSVKLTSIVTGGISPYTYSYAFVDDENTAISGSSSSVSVSMKEIGQTTVRVTVKDSEGTTKTADAIVNVADTMAVTINASPKMANFGEDIVLTAEATGGFGDYTYVFTDSKNNVINGSGNTRTVSYSEAGSYTIKVTATDKEENSVYKTVSLKIADELSIDMTASAQEINLGESVTLTTTAVNGFTSYKYKYTLEDGTVIGSSAKLTYTPKVAGDYNVTVTVTDQKGTVKTAQASFTVVGPLTAQLNADNEYTGVGSAVTLTAKAGGGKGNYKYVFKDASGTVLSSTGNTCVYTPVESGTYEITVTVTDGEGTSVSSSKKINAAEPMTVVLTPSEEEVMAGKTYKLTAVITGGFPAYTCVFTDAQGEKVSSSSNVTSAITAKKTGEYEYNVEVTDKSGNVVNASAKVVVKTDLAVSLTPSATTAYKDQTISVAAQATGGASTKTYEFTVNGEVVTASNNTVVVGPASGEYAVAVKVTDSNGNFVTASVTVKVESCTELINTSTLKTDEISVGQNLEIYASCEGGVAPYNYTYQYKKSSNTTWITLGEKNTTNQTGIFKSGSVADYDIRVIARDSQGHAKSEVLKVKVNPAYEPLVNVSTVPFTSVVKGTNVKITGKATGGKAPYYYTIQSRKAGSSSWQAVGEKNTTTNVQVFTPGAICTYEIRVIIKDSLNSTVSKLFTLDSVSGAPLKNESFVSTYSVPVGESLTVVGKASGGAAPYFYTAQYKKKSASSWTTIGQKDTTSTNFTFVPGAEETYEIRMIVKDNAGDMVSRVFTIEVTPSDSQPLKNTSTLSAESFIPGEVITINGSAAGGKAPYYYTIQYRRDSTNSWSTVGTRNSTTGTVTFKPGAKETYYVRVILKDALGTTKTKNFTLPVK